MKLNIVKKGNALKRTIILIVFFTFCFIFFASLTLSPEPNYLPISVLIYGLLLWFSIRWALSLKNKVDYKWIFVGIISLGFIIRLIWIIFVPTLPASDFYSYHESAKELSQNIVTLKKNMGFRLLLSLGYRIFPNILTGQMINVLFSTLSIFLIYLIGNKLLNRKVGLIAAFIFSIFPSEIIMCGVIGTEVTTTTIYLLVFLFLIKINSSNNNKYNFKMILLLGLFFGLGYTFRSSTIFYLPGILTFLILFGGIHKKIKIYNFLTFLFGSLVGLLFISGTLGIISGDFSFRSVGSQNLYPLLSGTNVKYSGEWNMEDSILYSSWPEDKREKLVIQTALDRMLTNPIEFLLLIIRKMGTLMGVNNYGSYWALEKINWGKEINADYIPSGKFLWDRALENINISKEFTIRISDLLTQSPYVFVWALCLISIKYFYNNKFGVYVFFIVLLTMLPHTILEVQGRYHHYIMPFIILFASIGLLKTHKIIHFFDIIGSTTFEKS